MFAFQKRASDSARYLYSTDCHFSYLCVGARDGQRQPGALVEHAGGRERGRRERQRAGIPRALLQSADSQHARPGAKQRRPPGILFTMFTLFAFASPRVQVSVHPGSREPACYINHVTCSVIDERGGKLRLTLPALRAVCTRSPCKYGCPGRDFRHGTAIPRAKRLIGH